MEIIELLHWRINSCIVFNLICCTIMNKKCTIWIERNFILESIHFKLLGFKLLWFVVGTGSVKPPYSVKNKLVLNEYLGDYMPFDLRTYFLGVNWFRISLRTDITITASHKFHLEAIPPFLTMWQSVLVYK